MSSRKQAWPSNQFQGKISNPANHEERVIQASSSHHDFKRHVPTQEQVRLYSRYPTIDVVGTKSGIEEHLLAKVHRTPAKLHKPKKRKYKVKYQNDDLL